MGKVDLAVFAPWRRVLRRLVRFHDAREHAAGMLHAKLRCVRLDFGNLHFLYDAYESEVGEENAQPVDDWKRGYLVQAREAVELIGLLLHSHKREAWPWFYKSDDFEYHADELEPLFELAFHDTVFYGRGDDVEDIEGGIEVLTRIDASALSEEYSYAKEYLRVITLGTYDPHYRVPVSFVLAPDKHVNSVKWCACVTHFAQALHAQSTTNYAKQWFDFVGMTLYIWRLCVDKSIVALLRELKLAQIHIPEVDLNLVDPRSIYAARRLTCCVGSIQRKKL